MTLESPQAQRQDARGTSLPKDVQPIAVEATEQRRKSTGGDPSPSPDFRTRGPVKQELAEQMSANLPREVW